MSSDSAVKPGRPGSRLSNKPSIDACAQSLSLGAHSSARQRQRASCSVLRFGPERDHRDIPAFFSSTIKVVELHSRFSVAAIRRQPRSSHQAAWKPSAHLTDAGGQHVLTSSRSIWSSCFASVSRHLRPLQNLCISRSWSPDVSVFVLDGHCTLAAHGAGAAYLSNGFMPFGEWRRESRSLLMNSTMSSSSKG